MGPGAEAPGFTNGRSRLFAGWDPGAAARDKGMTSLAVDTAVKRLAGERPSRVRAAAVASVAGFGTAALGYRLLRSGGGDEESA